MKIGIIGAGQIGGTLTRRFTALGHSVFVANLVCEFQRGVCDGAAIVEFCVSA